MATVAIEGMQFFAYHGVHPHERIEGGQFEVDVYLETDISSAAASDRVEDALDYEKVYNLIAGEMNIRADLLETLVIRILEKLLENHPDLLKSATLCLSKLSPPLKGPVKRTFVKETLNRST